MILGRRDGITIETFRGDLEDLHRMAVHSWRDEYGIESFPDLYHPRFVSYLSAGAPADHLVAAYDGDQCVSFVANVPRTVVWRGRELRACLAALLTSRRETLRRGIAEAMIRSALTLNERYRYDAIFFYAERGHRSSRLFGKLAAEGQRIVPLKRLWMWGRVLDLGRTARNAGLPAWQRGAIRALGLARPPGKPLPGVRAYRDGDLDACLALCDAAASRVDLGRRFTREELARTLASDDVAQTLVAERDGKAIAFVHWVVHDHLGPEAAPWAWVCHAPLHGLTARERRQFYAAFLRHVAAQGCAAVLEWGMGYHPIRPMVANRFFPYPRSVMLYAWILNPAIEPAPVRTVFEVQV
jgi:hypothetical protein